MRFEGIYLAGSVACVGAVALAVLSGCGSTVPAAPAASQTIPMHPLTSVAPESMTPAEYQEWVAGTWAELEMKVLNAFDDSDPHVFGAHYERTAGRLVLTIRHWPDEVIPQQQLEEYQSRAQEATGGVPVVLEVTDREVPHPA